MYILLSCWEGGNISDALKGLFTSLEYTHANSDRLPTNEPVFTKPLTTRSIVSYDA